MAAGDQVAHQRVMGREVEDVVLHDPGRYDQERQRMHLRRDRVVADQFAQVVAQHHPARRQGHLASRAKTGGGRGAARGVPGVDGGARRTGGQVHAATLPGDPQHHRIGEHEVRGRHAIEQLARDEGDDVGVVGGHAAHPAGGPVPPLLLHQEPLAPDIEGPAVPGRIVEALVLGQRGQRRGHIARCADGAIAQPTQGGGAGLGAQFDLLVGREQKVAAPVEPGHGQRRRRHMAGEAPQPGMQRQIGRRVPDRRLGSAVALALPGAGVALAHVARKRTWLVHGVLNARTGPAPGPVRAAPG